MRHVHFSLISIFIWVCVLSACSLAPKPPHDGSRDSGAKPETTTPDGLSGARSRDWKEYRKQAAAKIMQSNSSETYAGRPANVLASIPVLTIHLNADGSVRDIQVMRTPQAYPKTVALAKAAILRAAPFGSVRHLPKPWTFNETFLYNYDMKFQLYSLQAP
jgi:hypothetical protein